MEDEGLAVDWDFIDEAKDRAKIFHGKMQMGLIRHLKEDRHIQLPPKFNPGSHPQIRKVLYGKAPDGLGLSTHIMTKGKADGTGKQLATNALALKGNSSDPFVRRMLDYRGMTKLITTYLETWRQEFGWCECGRAHCHLLPHGTFTGRHSASDFNYQNLPKKYHYECDGGEFFFNFRDCVVAPPGYWGMGFDISQGELRIIAAEAGEQAMLDAFAKGEDLHILTAMRLLSLTKEEVLAGGELNGVQFSSEKGGFRPFGKTMNFALGYQLTVQGLADRLGCSIEDAAMHFSNYFLAYPAIAAWTRRTVAESKVNGFTMSRLGRRHPIWAYESDKSWVYTGGERTAGNAPIQGGLADMMKLIMIRVDAALAEAGLKDAVRMVMNVHDSLEFYVRKDVSPQAVIDLLCPVILQQTPWTQHWPLMVPEWHVWEKWGSPTELKLDENFQILGMGEVIDIGEQEEEDDDVDDAEVGAVGDVMASSRTGLPMGVDAVSRVSESAVSVLNAVDPVADRGRHHTGHVIVKVTEMPEMSALQRFVTLVTEFPGPNELTLDTPQGSYAVSHGTSLSPDDGARISLMLGGAAVTWSPDTVDYSKLGAGITL
jgi:hypothetical protein